MADPTLVPGTLYINRDRDYRTGELGRYVKLGIVKDERDAEKRNKEHQTGNPREVLTLHTFTAPMVEHLETQLHHRFADYWVSGEWFEMDDAFIASMVIPELQAIVAEQQAHEQDFIAKKDLKGQPSTGVVRAPSPEEVDAHANCIAAKEALALAKGHHELADLRVRALIGDSGGIPGVVRLISKGGQYFDKNGFEAAHPDLYASFLADKEGTVGGSLSAKGARSLAKLDADLDAAIKAAKAQLSKPSPSQVHADLGERTDAARDAHAAFVSTLAAVARAQWDVARWTARLARLCGTDDEVQGLLTWKRSQKPATPAFDAKRFKTEHPDLHASFTRDRAPSVSVDVHFFRAYPID
jgi:hypothetical protein